MNKLQTASLMQADNVKHYNHEAGIVRTAVLSPEQRAERPYHDPKPLPNPGGIPVTYGPSLHEPRPLPKPDISHEEALLIMYGSEAC